MFTGKDRSISNFLLKSLNRSLLRERLRNSSYVSKQILYYDHLCKG